MSIEKEIRISIEASIHIIQIISYETLRVHAALIKVARELGYKLFIWDRIEGKREWNFKEKRFSDSEGYESPIDILNHFEDLEQKSILLLQDFYPDMDESKPSVIRKLRNISLLNNSQKTLVFSQPHHFIPRELEKDVHIMELPYPNIEDIKAIYYKVCNKFNIKDEEPDEEILVAALGLTIMEVEKAFSMAYVQEEELTRRQVPMIIKEKENIIKKSGFLEYYHPKETLHDIGGLDNLKSWLNRRGRGFDKTAKEFGLDAPRGILLLGIPGTGKSLTAKAIGTLWQFPLLRLDMGKIFGGIVGESEHNIRNALKIAEAIAPCILWIDEIEKGMAGIESSGQTDGGTTARVLGTFLTWMQEKKQPVFVVATANNINQLPPELLRKGRFDEIFFVDLPTKSEREAILKIHLTKKKRNPNHFDISKIAEESKNFSGAELEECVKEALYQAYDQERDVQAGDIIEAIKKTYPLAKTMTEVIENMRKWAKSRAVMASSNEPEKIETKSEEKVPILKQEKYSNPFIP